MFRYFLIEEVINMPMIKCAVCGTEVSAEKAQKQEYKEESSYEKYYFCCAECRMEFLNDPDKYLGQSGRHIA